MTKLSNLYAILVTISIAGCSAGPTSIPAASSTFVAAPSLERDARTDAQTAPETPLASDALADSIGVNSGPRSNMSAEDWTKLESAMKDLGVRHVRAGILDSDPGYDQQLVDELSASNAMLDGITDCTGIELYPQSPTSPADIQQFDAAIGNRLEAVEGPNEVDTRNDKNWASDTVSCLPSLRSAEPSLPFIAPSLADPMNDASTLGDIASDVDYGNMHRYFSGFNPGTPGWGGTFACGTYGALDWALCESAINSGSKPVVITETGYDTQTEVDEATQAKYLSRLFLVNLKGGVSHSYIYTLIDYSPSDGFGGCGLLRVDLSRKPGFEAVARELAYFADPGPAAQLTPLAYTIAGTLRTTDHLLFQRRNGTYVLALWDESESWNPNSKRKLDVRPRTMTIALPFTPANPKAVAMNDKGLLETSPVATNGGKLSVSVDDHVTFVSFRAP